MNVKFKLITVILTCAISLTGCNIKSDSIAVELIKNTTISKDSITMSRDKLFTSYLECKVLEVKEKYATVKSLEDNITDKIIIQLCEENPKVSVGDVIRIKYDGCILETYPAQINNVYEIEIIKRTD